VNDAPRRVLQVLRGAAEAPLLESGADGTDVTTVAFDDVEADELLEQIFAADVVFVI
jgi:hypothetical protein